MKTVKDSAGILVTQSVATVINLLIGIITARFLGPAGKGLYVLAFVLPGLFVTFGNIGLTQAIVYNLAKHSERRDEVVGSLFIVWGGITGILTLAAYLSLPYTSQAFFPGVDTQLLKIGLLTLPASFWILCARECFRGAGQYTLYNAVGLLPKLLGLSFFIVVIIILEGGAVEAIYANTLATALMAGLCLLGVFKYVLGGVGKLSVAFVRPLLSYGTRVHAGLILQTLENRGDILLLSHYLISSAPIGLYSVGVTLAELVLNVSEAVGTVWLQRVSAALSTKMEHKTVELSRVVTIVSVFAGLLMVVVAYPAIYVLYGADFLPSYAPFLILLPGVVTRAPARIIGSHLQGVNRPGLISMVSGISLAVNIGINIVLIPQYGINGAALASTISYSLRSLVMLCLFSRFSSYSIFDCVLPQKDDWVFLTSIFRLVMNKLAPGYRSLSR
jgi:O-antigen/teichoic acid export membrane protein